MNTKSGSSGWLGNYLAVREGAGNKKDIAVFGEARRLFGGLD